MRPDLHRHAHRVSPTTLAWLRPLFRYSLTIDAYVLRGVGRRVGPILKEREPGADAASIRQSR